MTCIPETICKPTECIPTLAATNNNVVVRTLATEGSVMKRLFVIALLGFSLPALAQMPCAWNNTPASPGVSFTTALTGNSGMGTFLVEGFQLNVPSPGCLMSGHFAVWVSTADSGSGATSAIGLYYNSGGSGTVGGLYSTTGEFRNSTYFGFVNTGVKIPAEKTALCPAYPCTLPPGTYAVAFATNCLASGGKCPRLAGSTDAGVFSLFSTIQSFGYSAGLPSTVAAAPIAPRPVSFATRSAISVLVY